MTSGTHRASMSMEPSTACSASTEWGSCLSSSSSSSIGMFNHPQIMQNAECRMQNELYRPLCTF